MILYSNIPEHKHHARLSQTKWQQLSHHTSYRQAKLSTYISEMPLQGHTYVTKHDNEERVKTNTLGLQWGEDRPKWKVEIMLNFLISNKLKYC